MRSRFCGGPYDKVILNVPMLDHVQLPVWVTTGLPDHVEPREWLCQAKYQLIMKNDVEATYNFLSISAP